MKIENPPKKIKKTFLDTGIEIETIKEGGFETVNPKCYDKILNKKGDNLNGLSAKELILLLLGVDSEIPLKQTLLMKEAFLTEKELGPDLKINIKSLDFYPHHYGPYSKKLDNAINENIGDIIDVFTNGNKKLIKLTEKGEVLAKKLINSIPSDKVNKIRMKRIGWDQYGNRGILKRVYTDYPIFTVNSKIKDEILGDE